MKILVTGGAGFIGSHIVDALIKKGHRVVVIDNLSTGSKKNLNPKAKCYQFDIRSPRMEMVFRKERPEAVFHYAAQIDVRGSLANPLEDASVNIMGTLRVLNASLNAGVKRMIFASSGGAVYGDPSSMPISEDTPTAPASPYGISKLAAELYLRYTGVNHSLRWVSLRFANVYGPRQNPMAESGVVAIFSRRMLKGLPVTITGTGSQTRDFVFVSDVVRANLMALSSRSNGVFNIGTGRETSIRALYRLIARATQYHRQPLIVPAKEGESRRSALDSSCARRALGWRATVRLEQGIDKTIRFLRKM